MNLELTILLAALLPVNGFTTGRKQARSTDDTDLDDMEYDRDNGGDSLVPPILVVRNGDEEPVPMVQLPGKDGDFVPMTRINVQECKNNASKYEAAKYVKFYLYRTNATRDRYEFDLDGIGSIVQTDFRRDLPTALLIHGWLGNSDSLVIDPLAKALLEQDNKNVIAVDWEKGASTLLYPIARYRVPKVATIVAALIDFLVTDLGQDINGMGIIGHSLGAHIAGLSAKRVNAGKIRYIVGLDPASPLFRLKKTNERLSSDDAQYVEIIHTNGKGLGFYSNIGTADFYPNGGVMQPGCGINLSCSHQRAVGFFKESLKIRDYYAGRCDDLTNLGPTCASGRTVLGGLIWRSFKPSGVYYMSTASNEPFLRSDSHQVRCAAATWLITAIPLLVLQIRLY